MWIYIYLPFIGVHLSPSKKLEELDPEMPQYWRLLRKHNIWCRNNLSKSKKF
ncbi:unnamed protein product [Lepidochelys olivacea]